MALSGCCGREGLALRDGLSEGTGAHVWLHAADPAAHDFHAGAVGSFAASVARIRRGAAVSTLLTRSNARVLAALPAWLHAHGAAAWRIVVPRVEGAPRRDDTLQIAGVGALDGVVPRLSVALPYALHALGVARRLGLHIAVEGAPDCLLGPFAGVAIGAARSFAAVCDACPGRARCTGVDAVYLQRFAGDELSPLRRQAPAGTPASPGLFFGTGALAQVDKDMSSGPGALAQGKPDMSSGAGGVAQGKTDMFPGTGVSARVETGMSARTGVSAQGETDMSPGAGRRTRLPVLRGGDDR